MNRVITIFFGVICILASSYANTKGNSQSVLYGVDNVQLPNDSLVLMNSLLVDYQVDYDIALATKSPKDIVSSLHKIGLVYLKLEQYDLASHYAWRLFNVANKYSLENYQLYAYALLYRVNKDSGKVGEANKMLVEYQNMLPEISEDSALAHFIINHDTGTILESHVLTPEDLNKKNVEAPLPLVQIEKEASLLDRSFFVWLGLLGILGFLWFLYSSRNRQNHLAPILEVVEATVVDVIHTEIENKISETIPNNNLEVNYTAPVHEEALDPTEEVEEEIITVDDKIKEPSANMKSFLNQSAILLDKKAWKYDFSMVGEFHNFSDQSLAGVLYVLEELTQSVLANSLKEINIHAVEVPKGMVVNMYLSNSSVNWNHLNFDKWVKLVFDKFQLEIQLKPHGEQMTNLIIKKYY